MDQKTRQLMEKLAGPTAPQANSSGQIRGVGDVVAKVTKAVGIQECEPCSRRRNWLNKYFPIKSK